MSASSTLITSANVTLKAPKVGEHTLKVAFNNGVDATTKFTIAKAETNTSPTGNPQTGDNILFYISMLGLSVISLAGVGIYTKKKN